MTASGGSRFRELLRAAWARARGGELRPGRAASSVAVGLFVGALPLFGAQLLLCALICVPLRLDTVVAYVAAHVSNPLTVPLQLWLEMELGSWMLHGHAAQLSLAQLRASGVGHLSQQLAVGAVALGTVLACVGAALVWLILTLRRQPSASSFELALGRTLARYREAPPADRHYVSAKLRRDPAVAALLGLDTNFGALVDAGTGRGQLALLLLELGKVAEVFGFDSDARKVALAAQASHGEASFHCASMTDVDWPAADSVFFMDTLHYLDAEEQQRVLERSARALRPGGRLFVREVDAARGWRASLTIALEHCARAIGMNRARGFTFRTSAALVQSLERLGLECSVVPPAPGAALGNVLIIAHKPAQLPPSP